jgi:uncharacterized protein YcbX
MTATVGTIGALSRFPVKSMLGEALDAADIDQGGLVGDRAYAIRDRQTGKIASAKHPKVWPQLLACRARFSEPPSAGDDMPPAEIELADGTTVRTDASDVDDVLSRFFGRGVELARSAPEDFTIDQYHPDLENLDPEGHRDELTETKLGAALFREMGAPSAVPEGSFLDVCPVSVLTTSTLRRLGELEPGSRFDTRRFRMNLIVDTADEGFPENAWIGHTIAVGDEVRLMAIMPDPRCVMTTVAQGDLPRDPQVLKTLAQHNRLDVAGGGLFPCCGVYAVTESTGAIRAGDVVTLA